MVTRHNRPEMDASHTVEELRALLSERTSEATRLRRRIEELENLGARFLASASHAVMNPITIIRSYLEVLLSDLGAGISSDQTEFVRTALSATLKLNRLVDGIVELAALELGVAELEIASVDLGRIVGGATEAHAAEAEASGIELSVAITPNLPRVNADANRLKSSIGEIVSNAFQATPPGGRVELTALLRGGEVVVRVADTGRGIPRDRLDEVFEPFVRLPRGEDEHRPGAGLGLSIARRQIEAMGGRIEMSTEVGRGTAVEIVLPASTDEVPA